MAWANNVHTNKVWPEDLSPGEWTTTHPFITQVEGPGEELSGTPAALRESHAEEGHGHWLCSSCRPDLRELRNLVHFQQPHIMDSTSRIKVTQIRSHKVSLPVEWECSRQLLAWRVGHEGRSHTGCVSSYLLLCVKISSSAQWVTAPTSSGDFTLARQSL